LATELADQFPGQLFHILSAVVCRGCDELIMIPDFVLSSSTGLPNLTISIDSL
jgi:hypothetical protein